MLVRKGFRFRIYPTREQAATLVRWESTLRFLWNIANEQRLIGLARRIAGAGWSKFANMLQYKLAWSGGQLVEVPAPYSSQTCSQCRRVSPLSRHGERFCCVFCGHVDHADLNAAKVLKQRFDTPGKPWCLPVEGLLPEGSRRSRKLKVKLRIPRR